MRMFQSGSGHRSEQSRARYGSRSTVSQLKGVFDTISNWFENHKSQRIKIMLLSAFKKLESNSLQVERNRKFSGSQGGGGGGVYVLGVRTNPDLEVDGRLTQSQGSTRTVVTFWEAKLHVFIITWKQLKPSKVFYMDMSTSRQDLSLGPGQTSNLSSVDRFSE